MLLKDSPFRFRYCQRIENCILLTFGYSPLLVLEQADSRLRSLSLKINNFPWLCVRSSRIRMSLSPESAH